MHIETLKVFCDLAHLQSFSKTAEKHLLSQSAVSQQLAQLELTHKCQLFDRKKRPIELTKEGQLLYKAASDMLERYGQLKSELKALKSSAGARINIAAIFSIGMHTLPDYVKQFMVEYPNVNVHIEYFSASKIYELVLSGDVDIGLVAVPKRDKRLDVYDFEDELLIGFEQDVPTRVWIDGILQRYNISVQMVMEFDNIETVKRAVEINSGVSILPRTAIEQELNTGVLKGIPFSNENFVRPTGIIVRKNRIRSRAGRYFVELLCKKAL